MARADILLDLIAAGSQHDDRRFREVLRALIAEEREKQHHVLADRLTKMMETTLWARQTAPEKAAQREAVSDLVYESTPSRTLDSLVLPDMVINQVRELVEEQDRAEVLRANGLEPRSRVLLAGPPGNGKTTLAEAVADALLVPLISVRQDAVIGSFLGETAERLRRVFDYVKTRRCVLLIDEFDALGKERGDEHEVGEIKRVVSALLQQIDDLPSYVVVMTATNHAELLDRAVWRRFQLRLLLPPPTEKQRVEWFRRFSEAHDLKLGAAPASLASHFDGTSWAELEEFSRGILRRLVLDGHRSSSARVVKDRLAAWELRFGPRDR